jgi:hypothetical protein
MGLGAVLLGRDAPLGGAGTCLLLTGLAVISLAGDRIPLRRSRVLRNAWLAVVTAPVLLVVWLVVLQPWVNGTAAPIATPAPAIGRFLAENFERRTGQLPDAVAGDPELASLVAFTATGRPHLWFEQPSPLAVSTAPSVFAKRGGVVVWRAADTAGTPPADLAKRFPGLVPEVPRVFPRLVDGRASPVMMGWAVVRPTAP